MSDSQKTTIRRAAFVIAALGLLVPVTVSPGQGVEGNEACAGATCCREMNSLCDGTGEPTLHYYNDANGSCNGSSVTGPGAEPTSDGGN